MIAGIAGLARRRAPRARIALALLALAGMGAAFAQEPAGAPASPAPFSALPPVLEKQYRTVRSLVVTRGACVVFEYYRRDIGAGTRSPVYSVTKSALAILIGVAVDRGYLRLDQKLSELLPETLEAHVDPQVREIKLRDLMT